MVSTHLKNLSWIHHLDNILIDLFLQNSNMSTLSQIMVQWNMGISPILVSFQLGWISTKNHDHDDYLEISWYLPTFTIKSQTIPIRHGKTGSFFQNPPPGFFPTSSSEFRLAFARPKSVNLAWRGQVEMISYLMEEVLLFSQTEMIFKMMM